jgi:nicotinamidase/pyrazinamidase
MSDPRYLSRRSILAALGAGTAIAALPFAARGETKFTPGKNDVLIVVDVQNCFTKGGSLEVKNGDEVVPIINALAGKFENVVLTQDWHTPGHVSFASQHSGKKPFETVKLAYGTQVCGRTTACKAPTARR